MIMELSANDALKVSIFSLSREKEIYIITSYTLIGLSFFATGLFSFSTGKLPFIIGFIAILAGILLPVFTSLIKESVLTDVGLVLSCIMFFILGIRLLFKGLIKKKRKRAIRKRIEKVEAAD